MQPSCHIIPSAVTDTCISSAGNCCDFSLADQKFNDIQKEKPLAFKPVPQGRRAILPFAS